MRRPPHPLKQTPDECPSIGDLRVHAVRLKADPLVSFCTPAPGRHVYVEETAPCPYGYWRQKGRDDMPTRTRASPQGEKMRRCLESIVVVVMLTALHGCGTSPTAPRQTGPAEFDPTALFTRLAGPYTLTFEADASCPLPSSLNVLTYDVLLEPVLRYRYLSVRVPSEDFAGDLWALATEEEGLAFRWNVDCEADPDTVGSTTFHLCGQAPAFVTDGTISGVLGGANVYLDQDRRPYCTDGSHRFVFHRRN